MADWNQTDLIERGWDDVTRQACGGSVAAIIQILNEKLADTGIRTRAVLVGSTLQLLCEAEDPAALDQDATVDRVRGILEHLAPRGIRRVRINGRIMQEQQLLWLQAIERDPAGQLLWSEEIPLKRSHWFRWTARDWSMRSQSPRVLSALPGKSSRAAAAGGKTDDRHLFWVGLLGGVGISIGLATLVAWWAGWVGGPRPDSPPAIANGAENGAENGAAPGTGGESPDPFVQAVRLAESAANEGQTADTLAQWEDLAERWEQAADLMASVPPSDRRYATARDRAEAYRQNQTLAEQQVQRLQQQSP